MFFSKSMTFGEDEAAATALIPSRANAAEDRFVERLKGGDAAAFDTLVVRYSADIYALVFRLTGNAEEAADLTQETFLRALKAIKNFRGEADLKTWLYRIAVNEARNRFRWWTRRRREKTVSLDAPLAEENETSFGETISSASENPEQEIMRRERAQKLSDALQNLPDIFREAVVLCDIEGLRYEEIARTLSINVGTVKSRIARGREELRRTLQDI